VRVRSLRECAPPCPVCLYSPVCSSVVKAAVGMFISCGMIGYNRQLADDKALEVMLHNAPAEGNTVYERDIEKYVNTVRAKTLEALQMLIEGHRMYRIPQAS
jgi:hypothetical protein